MNTFNHRIWPITGGVYLEANKHQSTRTSIKPTPIPTLLYFPLSLHKGNPAKPVVAVGDSILKGQMIAQATDLVSSPVHASSSGKIIAIENRIQINGDPDTCIILETDKKNQWCELFPTRNYRQETTDSLINKISNAGVVGMGGDGLPITMKLAATTKISTLILNGAECEPYISADDMLMRERSEEIAIGLAILQHLLQTEECLIAIEDNKPEALAAMRLALKQSNEQKKTAIKVLPTAYPSGEERRLIKLLTGQELPFNQLPEKFGILTLNIATVLAIKEAIIDGKPLISRITTITGNALAEPQNMEVLVGTTAKYVLDLAGLNPKKMASLIVGGPMMGCTASYIEIPVIKTTRCLIAATKEEFPPSPPESACIRCGLCAEVCPSSLLPQQLYWHSRSDDMNKLKKYNLFNCIECGACSYVCPSSIPLVHYYRKSKAAIRMHEARFVKSTHSKKRYKARLARLEKEKIEKQAMRKKITTLAEKSKLYSDLEAIEQEKTTTNKNTEDPVLAAVARVKARKKTGGGSTRSKKTD